jgi:hypothetical protein
VTSAAGNSCADKLRDLHERGRYWGGLSLGTNADRARDAGNEAWGLLPEIAAVIEAAEAVSAIERTGVLPDFQPLADGLAALSARLGDVPSQGRCVVRRDAPHIRIVECLGDGEWDMYVQHPDSCPTVLLAAGHDGFPPDLTAHDCMTAHSIDAIGFDDFPDPEELGEGEHHFQTWASGPDYLGEYDGGVTMLDGAS